MRSVSRQRQDAGLPSWRMTLGTYRNSTETKRRSRAAGTFDKDIKIKPPAQLEHIDDKPGRSRPFHETT